MRNISSLSTAVVCLGLTVACSGGNRAASGDERQNTTPGNATAAEATRAAATGRPAPITATGCLTSANGRFVLTQLEEAAAATEGATTAGAPARPTTETYQLTNADDQLRQYVGRQVRVNGEAAPAQVAEVRETTPAAQAGSATGTSGSQAGGNGATVSTETATRFESRRLSVLSVTPTGDACPAGQR